MKAIKIGNFELGKGKTFIIAELSANHNGSLETAIQTIKAAKKAGADCIKLQTYTADSITLNIKNDYFRIKQGTVWDGRYLYDLYQEAYTPWDWHKELFRVAKEEGLICFSSPFDKAAVDLLESLDAPAYKIASFEITDVPLIEYVASKNKPVIISTGIADEEDIALAIETCKKAGNDQIILLQCTSEYPATPESAILSNISEIIKKFGVLSGLSDHTLGIEAAILSVALGSAVIEKHFILDKKIGGVDSHFSLDSEDFQKMVEGVRLAEKMIGSPNFEMTEKKKRSREFSRSLFIAEDIKAGEKFTENNVRSVRPGFGMHPKHLKNILGKTAAHDLQSGNPLKNDDII
ncbi:MAG: pseudaminic acid synthase [Crocinitomicaceae bacterium]|nr:pseudaminic acid synthase [Crocinitomicaceae bacterium]MBK8924890.1 pseudaminic acid synthase [Crocinitomicaceae bacterium]